MISDWRGERRISRPGLGEILSAEIRKPLVITGILAIGSAGIMALRLLFGERYSPEGMVMSWCVTFAVLSLSITLSAFLARRWTQAWLLLGLTAALTSLVWFATLPVLSAVGLLPDAIIATTPR